MCKYCEREENGMFNPFSSETELVIDNGIRQEKNIKSSLFVVKETENKYPHIYLRTIFEENGVVTYVKTNAIIKYCPFCGEMLK